MITAGTVASLQQRPVHSLLILSLFGAVGKTLGGWLLYKFADKAEDIVTTKFGKFVGISHKEVESLGKYFNHGIRDDLILFLIRCLPVVPSAPLSLGCGIIKIKARTFLLSTFFGTIVRDGLFLYFGYVGVNSFNSVIGGLDTVESAVQIGLFFGLGLLIGWAYWKRHKRKKTLEG